MKRICILLTLIFLIAQPINAESPRQSQRLLLELNGSTADFEEELARYYPSETILEKFDTLFNGIAIEGRRHQLDRIGELDAVKQAYPITTYTVTPENIQLLNQADLNLPAQPQPTDQTYTGKGIKIGVIDTGID